ncbi:MAG: hypothetical protein K2P54_02950 [Odoribacter sp.]|nr:hypothetical protein [Odoribacter sp.]
MQSKKSIAFKHNDPLLKYAIYKTHNYRCAYTGKFLYDYSSINFDHIIPQDTTSEILQEKIKKYHLSKDFTIDSLENILPTKPYHNNNQKNRFPFSESTKRFFIELAQRKKWEIEKEYKILKKQFVLSKFKIFAETQLLEFNLFPPERYTKKRQIINSLPFGNHFWRSTQNIALNGFLPSPLKESGSCVISFANRTIMITLDHHNILQIINKTNTFSLNDIILRGYSSENKKSFIVLGNNAVHLENTEYEELVEILQDYLRAYRKAFHKFKEYVGVEDFSLYKNTDDYILLVTNRENWRKLIQYTKIYDLNQGNTPEYCFNYNGQNILALSPNNNIKFRLLPASSIQEQTSFLYPDNQVCILWELPDTESRKAITSGDVWTAQQTYEWLKRMLELFAKENASASTNPTPPNLFLKFFTHIFK